MHALLHPGGHGIVKELLGVQALELRYRLDSTEASEPHLAMVGAEARSLYPAKGKGWQGVSNQTVVDVHGPRLQPVRVSVHDRSHVGGVALEWLVVETTYQKPFLLKTTFMSSFWLMAGARPLRSMGTALVCRRGIICRRGTVERIGVATNIDRRGSIAR